MAFDKSQYQREYQNRKNAEARDISIRKCADPKRRKRCLADPLDFLKTYYGPRFFRPFSDDQIEAIYTIVECAEYGSDELICAARGDWKTETTKHMLIYLICQKLVTFPVLIGATAGSASESFEHIKIQMHSEIFAEDFPEIADPVIALENSPQRARRQTYQGNLTNLVWGSDKICLAQIEKVPGTDEPSPYGRVKMTYRGLDAHIRGINIRGDRPDIAIGDDLETRESAESDKQIADRETVLDKDVGGLAGGGETLPRIMIGTVQNEKCLTNKKLKEWGGKRYQAVRKWAEDEQSIKLKDEFVEMWKAEKEKGDKTHDESYEFYLANQNMIELDVEVSNPHNVSSKTRRDGRPVHISAFHRICVEEADKGWDYVLTELQNDPPKEQDVETIGLTHTKVMTSISGVARRILPPETLFVTAAIDLGKYGCHWEIRAWLDGLVGCTVNYGVAEVHGIGTHSDQEHVDMAIRRTLHKWREQLLACELCEQPPHNVLIDSGTPMLGKTGSGDHSDVVYGFIKEVQDGTSTFKASKGLSPYRAHYEAVEGKRIVGEHWHANLQLEHGIWLYNLDSDWLKNQIHQMWLTPTFDENQTLNPMSLSLFAANDEQGNPDTRRHLSYGKHQVAEEYRQQFIPGKGLKRWWHKVNPNNHWFDTSYMNLAAAIMLGMWMPIGATPILLPPVKQSERKRPYRNHRGEPFLARR